jgi:hypothetical protein
MRGRIYILVFHTNIKGQELYEDKYFLNKKDAKIHAKNRVNQLDNFYIDRKYHFNII